MVFTSLTANKKDVFIEEPIVISLEGTGYTETNLTTTNSKVTITKITNTVYEISSTEATVCKLYAELKNGSKTQFKYVDLYFYQHGILNFKTVEGITVNSDTSDKISKLLGEPDVKSNSTSGLSEYWRYFDKGLSFTVLKSNQLVDAINVYSSNFSYTSESNITKYYVSYSYEIGNGLKINTSTMDAAIAILGTPVEKTSNPTDPTSTFRQYKFTYQNQNMYLGFYGATVEDYTNKSIKSLLLY